jgi:hypothetical protein
VSGSVGPVTITRRKPHSAGFSKEFSNDAAAIQYAGLPGPSAVDQYEHAPKQEYRSA